MALCSLVSVAGSIVFIDSLPRFVIGAIKSLSELTVRALACSKAFGGNSLISQAIGSTSVRSRDILILNRPRSTSIPHL